jgi:chromosomal replication initiation ATPase DnaA
LASDERILGSGDFIAKVVSQAEEKLRESLRLQTKKIDLQKLLFRVSRLKDIEEDSILSGARARKVVIVRRLFCQLAVKKFGLSGAEVARYLGTSTSSVTRLANSPELPEFHHPDYAI